MKLAQYVMSLDLGTTGLNVLLFDSQGKLIEHYEKDLPIYFPQAGWVEQDAEEIFEHVRDAIGAALSQSKISAKQIAAMGITNQRESIAMWHKDTRQALSPVISWQCKRTKYICDRWKAQALEAKVLNKTGLPLDAYFSASKIKWILENSDEAKAHPSKQLAFGTLDTWIIHKLCGKDSFVTDMTNASRTMLFNIHEKKWDVELLNVFGIDPETLAVVKPSLAPFGEVDKTWFGAGFPVVAVLGDQQASLYGHDIFSSGSAKCTFGTGAFLLSFEGEKQTYNSGTNMFTTLASTQAGQPSYAREGAIFMAGATLTWLKDTLKVLAKVSDVDAMIQSCGNERVYVVPAFAGLGSPYWKDHVQASVFGMTRQTDARHLARAAIECIAFQVNDLIQNSNIQTLSIDGGVSKSMYFRQFLADILNITVYQKNFDDCTALGVAKLAARFLPNFSSPGVGLSGNTSYSPKLAKNQREALLRSWRKALQATMQFHDNP